jgi:hypothetical protein
MSGVEVGDNVFPAAGVAFSLYCWLHAVEGGSVRLGRSQFPLSRERATQRMQNEGLSANDLKETASSASRKVLTTA